MSSPYDDERPEQFRAGLASLEAAVRAGGTGAVLERYDVAVFSRS
ncbi:hypothetical protein [Streptomyces sp. NRRL F-5123]|nr:hypothetical protein [Streptomyces sp. NRRL F-5123]